VHRLVDAPAKVNLCLLVGPRRADSYHELFSVFAVVDLCDEMEFSLALRAADEGAGPGLIELDCPGIEGGDNLAIRALRAVEKLTNRSITGRVRIEKHIPVGAGMGGGCWAAAAAGGGAARLLDEEGGVRLEPSLLHDVARSLGADVPFFLEGRSALARGIGDRLQAISLPPLALVLVLPEEHLGTKDVYAEFDRQSALDEGPGFAERAARAEASWARVSAARADSGPDSTEAAAAIAGLLENDLEAASFSLLPELVDRRRAIEEEVALGALMSGSGPTLFGVCASPDHAAEVGRRLAGRGYRTQVVMTS
jgi:4-diphosphocytidyl-2-C-methyl-D-erythritol kinase